MTSFLFALILLITHPKESGRGFFSVMDHIFGHLNLFEKEVGRFQGVEINLANRGLYYDPTKGPNFWNYYFEPVQTPRYGKENLTILYEYLDARISMEFEYNISREEAHALIEKYLHLKPEVQHRIDAITDSFHSHFVLGIHYRGTDKIYEAPLLSYDEMLVHIAEALKDAPENFLLFVATDDALFLEKVKGAYGERVLFQKEATRSLNGAPIHFKPPSPYNAGLEAIVDCVALSCSDKLLRTSSNLSRWSSYFNPDLPVIELTKRR